MFVVRNVHSELHTQPRGHGQGSRYSPYWKGTILGSKKCGYAEEIKILEGAALTRAKKIPDLTGRIPYLIKSLQLYRLSNSEALLKVPEEIPSRKCVAPECWRGGVGSYVSWRTV